MSTKEIRETYGLYGNDAFEMFDTDSVPPEAVGEALGDEEAREYTNWIYYNVK